MHSANDKIRTSVSTETARAMSAYFSNCDLFTFLLHISIHLLLIAKTWAADIGKKGAPRPFLLYLRPRSRGDLRRRIAGLSAVAPPPLKPQLLLKSHEFDNCYHCCS